MAGTDFFTAEVLTLRGLVTYYVLFCIHLETRRVDIAEILWIERALFEWLGRAMKRAGVALSLVVAILAGLCVKANADEVPKDLAGQYAPGGDCKNEPRLIVDGHGILVQSGGKQSKLAPVDVCRTCAGGIRYEGIEVWIGPNSKGGDQPFVFRFNANEKRGTVLVEQLGRKALPPIVAKMVAGSPYMRCRSS